MKLQTSWSETFCNMRSRFTRIRSGPDVMYEKIAADTMMEKERSYKHDCSTGFLLRAGAMAVQCVPEAATATRGRRRAYSHQHVLCLQIRSLPQLQTMISHTTYGTTRDAVSATALAPNTPVHTEQGTCLMAWRRVSWHCSSSREPATSEKSSSLRRAASWPSAMNVITLLALVLA